MATFILSTDILLRAYTVLFSIAVLFFGFQLARDTSVGDNQVRLKVIAFASAVLLPYLGFRKQLLQALSDAGLPLSRLPSWGEGGLDIVSLAIIVAVVIIAGLVLWSLQPRPAMGPPPDNIEDVLPKITNLDRLAILKTTLRGHLDQIDSATRWNDANYVPLEAEVQIIEGRSSRRKIVDLLTALRYDQKTRLFVVLGEPGTGKSVAMRKLVRDLLAESGRSARIPVYINLKEWRTENAWTVQSPPTPEEFYNFLFHNMLQALDFNSQSFLQENDNFQRLFAAGYFFFVLDSFDEIPAVLDQDENSWLIEALSNSIVTCALGGLNSRAVISSRLFRKPKIISQHRSVFEIRPFSDDRIVRAIRNAANNAERLTKIVLTERPDLGAIARNPFLLHLIIGHYNQTESAPASQAEMFQTFFQSNLTLARRTFGFKQVSDGGIYAMCENISITMFKGADIGLEITDIELRKQIDDPLLPEVMRFLAQARIARIGDASGTFSFSHRRFNEYFLVRSLASGKTPVPNDAIQTDSRWRDALVLYAEIAPEADARRLLDHAWTYASKIGSLTLGSDRAAFIEARHALRFINEGFRNRVSLLNNQHKPLATIIRNKLAADCDYIEKKTVVEALGVLPETESYSLILDVLSKYPGWISESVAAAARYLPKINNDLAMALFDFITNRPWLDGLRQTNKAEPIFAISASFSKVRKLLRLYELDVYIGILAVVLLMSVSTWYMNETVLRCFLFVLVGIILCNFIGLVLLYATTLDVYAGMLDKLSRIDVVPVIVGAFVLRAVGGPYVGKFFSMSSSPIYFKGGSVEMTMIFGSAILGVFSRSPRLWFSGNLSVFFRGVKRRIGMICAWVICYSGIIFLDHVLPESWKEFLSVIVKYVGSGVLLIMCSTGAYFGIKGIICDLHRFSNYKKAFNPSRATIASQFNSLKTQLVRKSYVNWLEKVSIDHIETMRNLSNTWPAGKRSQINGDTTTVQLAQLDARWLDLD